MEQHKRQAAINRWQQSQLCTTADVNVYVNTFNLETGRPKRTPQDDQLENVKAKQSLCLGPCAHACVLQFGPRANSCGSGAIPHEQRFQAL